MRLYDDEADDAEPVYAASEVDSYIEELRTSIEELRSDLRKRDQQIAALRAAGEVLRLATLRADAILNGSLVQANTFDRHAVDPVSGNHTSNVQTASALQDDRSYFESLRRRIRSSEDADGPDRDR
ncbi:MAG: hypothetical protein NVS3B21_15650 [Acidimicrobiales bacterium]